MRVEKQPMGKGAPSVRGRAGAATEGAGMFPSFGLRSGVWF